MTAQQLVAWLRDACPGERIEYYRGHLGFTRGSAAWIDHYGRALLGKEARDELGELADEAMKLEQKGVVFLFQKKYDALDYGYVAVRPYPMPR